MTVEQIGTNDPIELLSAALKDNVGVRSWRLFKENGATKLVDLIKKAGPDRMRLIKIDLAGDFNAIYWIKQPVPRRPNPGQSLRVDDEAVYHLRYEDDWRRESPPPLRILALLKPIDAYHPNVNLDPSGAPRAIVCLGKTLPPSIRPDEIVRLGYLATTLQTVMLNEMDPEGVLNFPSCEFFRSHPEYRPLTRAGLMDTWEKWEGVEG